MSDAEVKPIALIGLMGAGKSVVARALGARLHGRVEDLDHRIEAGAGSTVAEIFALEGESGFRLRETAALEAALAAAPAVIACGGGVVLDPGNRTELRERCRTVWLEVAPAIAARRVAAHSAVRPLLGPGPLEARLEALLRERAPLYESVAAARVDSGDDPPESIAERVLAGLAAAREVR